MLFKKIAVLALLLTAGLSSAFADNFYVGIGGGISSFNDKQKTTISDPGMAPITHSLGVTGAIGSALGGYNFVFNNNWNLGTEAFYTTSSKKIDSIDPPNQDFPKREESFSWNYAYGLRTLPGYQIFSNILGYAILGVTKGSFNIDDSGAYSVTSTDFSVYGYQLGLGTSIALPKNFGARLDFIYSRYTNHTTHGISSYGSLAGKPMAYKDSPNSFSGILSVTYKFL